MRAPGSQAGTTRGGWAVAHGPVWSLTGKTCHNSGMAWFGVTIVVPPGTVGTTGAANHIAVGSGGCKTCHTSNFVPGGFKITTPPSLSAPGHAAGAGPDLYSRPPAANRPRD